MRLLSAVALLALACWCRGQSLTRSPCPDVLKYESPSGEQDRWYAVISISTDSTISSLWLNIVLDGKAELLGNWVGDVTSTDNTEFKIENTLMRIQPGPPTDIRFFVKYNLLMKIPMVSEIRLNGREICNISTPTVFRPDLESEVSSDSESTSEDNRPVSWNNNRETEPSVVNRPYGPVYTQPETPIFTATAPTENVTPILSNINSGTSDWLQRYTNSQSMFPNSALTSEQEPNKTNQQLLLTNSQPVQSNRWPGVSNSQPVLPNSRPVHTNSPPTGSNSQPEIFSPQPVQPKPQPNSNFATMPANVNQDSCGTVIPNPRPLLLNGKATLEGQWPWHVALYQFHNVDSNYICGGTLVSQRHVVTAAHCVTLKWSHRVVDKNTLSVYLGKHNLRTSTRGVQILFVQDIIVFPKYNASTFGNDLSILSLRGSAHITDFVRLACIWPEELVDLSYIVGYEGTVVGWGYDATDTATEELLMVQMPVVDRGTCINSNSLFFGTYATDTTYCAGYRDGTSACNGDSGGGMVMNIGGKWYLRGLVSISISNPTVICASTNYILFTDVAKYLLWIKEILRS